VLADLECVGPVLAVHGNRDDDELLRRLPERRVVEAGEVRIGMVHDGGHAAGRGARLVSTFPGCDAVVYGHTHVPEVERHDGVWILNPGSPTERRGRTPHRTLIELRTHPLEPRLVRLP